jgi:transcription initiation factor TFIIB
LLSSRIRKSPGRSRAPLKVDSETRSVSGIASKVGLSEKTSTRALVILKRAEESGISAGKDPVSLAAAALYAACILEGEDKTQKDLAEAAGVAEVTIREMFKDLRDVLGI